MIVHGKPAGIVNNESGSALLIAMMILILATIIGFAATDTSTVENQIAGSDRLYKIAFYKADGGTGAGHELLEQNAYERDWTDDSDRGNIRVENGDFYLNDTSDTPDPIPSDTNRDAYFPKSASTGQPHTNLKILGGATSVGVGAAISLAEAYSGIGTAAGSGGVWIVYNIRAGNQGVNNSRAMVNLGWLHVVK